MISFQVTTVQTTGNAPAAQAGRHRSLTKSGSTSAA